MTPERIEQLAAEGYNRIPLVREVFADLDTPVSAYLKLANRPCSYLLESVQGGEKWGRYSIIGLPCKTIIQVRGHKIQVFEQGRIISHQEVDDPLTWIEDFQSRYRIPEIEGLPRFTGGLVGYFGYDTIAYIEPRLDGDGKPDPLGTPDILLMLSEQLVVFDNLKGSLYFVVHIDPSQPDALAQGEGRLRELEQQLRRPVPTYGLSGLEREVGESDFVSGFTKRGFNEAVDKAKQYIVDGDVMQVVLSQRLSIPFKAQAVDLYRILRSLNPSPYMYFINFEGFQIVGSSPEILVHLEDRKVTVRPIAGTRPRGRDDREDRENERNLLADPKELAEHLMLIDLGRNDVGRVSNIGTVRLTEKMLIERYSHVMHIVSNVTGELQQGRTTMDVLRATFPAGTLSGAPKIRAMEIIDELEPVKRGIYGGAVGYIAWNGNMDTAIAIRTAVIKDGHLHIQAGAGIVYDSISENEWAETMNKARAIFRAVARVENGLAK
ncbi:MAG: anthranilate synthase component I [Gammaproteobacteria bacterium]|nr:anthranilate synthase component I [Gammaproteobacteria bacterium]